MKLLLAIAFSALAFAQTQGQSGDTSYIVIPYTEYCGSAPCTAPDKSGVFVHLQSSGNFDAYRVTVRFKNPSGIEYSISQLQDRVHMPGWWTNIQFKIGKVQQFLSVRIDQLVNSVEPSIVIVP